MRDNSSRSAAINCFDRAYAAANLSWASGSSTVSSFLRAFWGKDVRHFTSLGYVANRLSEGLLLELLLYSVVVLLFALLDVASKLALLGDLRSGSISSAR